MSQGGFFTMTPGSGGAGGAVCAFPPGTDGGNITCSPGKRQTPDGKDGSVFFKDANGVEYLSIRPDGLYLFGNRVKIVRRGFWPFRRYYTLELDVDPVREVLDALGRDNGP